MFVVPFRESVGVVAGAGVVASADIVDPGRQLDAVRHPLVLLVVGIPERPLTYRWVELGYRHIGSQLELGYRHIGSKLELDYHHVGN